MDTFEGESRRLAALRQNASLSVPSDYNDQNNEIQMEQSGQAAQAVSNSEQSALTHVHVTTATTNQPQNDSYQQQLQSLTVLLIKYKEMSKSALVKQLAQLPESLIEKARSCLFKQMEEECKAKCEE